MNIMRPLLLILLLLLCADLTLVIAHQAAWQRPRRISEQRLLELLVQSRRMEDRLAAVAEQNEQLTTRTLVILERLAPAPPYTPCHEPDEPVVLYETTPLRPAGKGSRP